MSNLHSLCSASAAGLVATLQHSQFVAWVAAMASIQTSHPEQADNDGVEQVSRICRQIIRRNYHATGAAWSRIQSAYWISTDDYGTLVPARLANVLSY